MKNLFQSFFHTENQYLCEFLLLLDSGKSINTALFGGEENPSKITIEPLNIINHYRHPSESNN